MVMTEFAADFGLECEFADAATRLLADPLAIKKMRSLGVSIEHCRRVEACFGILPLGLTTNRKSFVQPVVAYDHLVDLISWRPTDPSTWHLRHRMAVILGEEQADRAAFDDKPLMMYLMRQRQLHPQLDRLAELIAEVKIRLDLVDPNLSIGIAAAGGWYHDGP